MDWIACKRKGQEYLKKYRCVLLVVLAGVVLMSLPVADSEEAPVSQPQPTVQTPDLQQSLEEILTKISGAGKVEVLLTQSEGERTIYQTDEESSYGEASGDIRSQTVLITNADRGETGLIRQIDPPSYRGAVIVCQGGDSPQVKLAIVEAVSNATGLTADKICVLKMK